MKLLIWGTGATVGFIIDKFVDFSNVIGFVESRKHLDVYMNKKIYEPSEITQIDYDAIIVANTYSDQIYNICIENNIDLDRVIFL